MTGIFMYYENNKFIIITGASGSGKTSIRSELIKNYPDMFEIHKSYTTREHRDSEDFRYYHFISIDEFFDKIRNSEFIEWEEIYSNSYYGTPKSGILNCSKIKILTKDVKGAKFLKRLYGDKCILIYLKTKNPEEFKDRIVKDSDRDNLKERFARIEYENSFTDLNEDIVIDTSETSLNECSKIIFNNISNF